MPTKAVIECYTYDELGTAAREVARAGVSDIHTRQALANPKRSPKQVAEIAYRKFQAREKHARQYRSGFQADGTPVHAPEAEQPLLLIQFNEREILDLVCGKRGKRRATLAKLRAGAVSSIKSRMVEACTEVLETVDL